MVNNNTQRENIPPPLTFAVSMKEFYDVYSFDKT